MGAASWQQMKTLETYLTDMVPEDGLVLCTSDVPLEPGLRLPIVGYFKSSGSITDLWKVGHGVPHCNSAVDTTVPSKDRWINTNIVNT